MSSLKKRRFEVVMFGAHVSESTLKGTIQQDLGFFHHVGPNSRTNGGLGGSRNSPQIMIQVSDDKPMAWIQELTI